MEIRLLPIVPAIGTQITLDPCLQRDARIATSVAGHVSGAIRDARAMGQQEAKRNGFIRVRRVPYGKGQIVVDVVIQLEPALFPKLHGGRGGHSLRDGTDVLNRMIGVHRYTSFHAGPSVAP